MLKFFVDACLPKSSARLLKRLGYDVVDAREVSLGRAKDSLIFGYAQKEGRIIVTRDKGFGNLLEYPLGSHEGIIVLRLPSTYTAIQINKVLEAFMRDVAAQRLERKLAIVEVGRYRIRDP